MAVWTFGFRASESVTTRHGQHTCFICNDITMSTSMSIDLDLGFVPNKLEVDCLCPTEGQSGCPAHFPFPPTPYLLGMGCPLPVIVHPDNLARAPFGVVDNYPLLPVLFGPGPKVDYPVLLDDPLYEPRYRLRKALCSVPPSHRLYIRALPLPLVPCSVSPTPLWVTHDIGQPGMACPECECWMVPSGLPRPRRQDDPDFTCVCCSMEFMDTRDDFEDASTELYSQTWDGDGWETDYDSDGDPVRLARPESMMHLRFTKCERKRTGVVNPPECFNCGCHHKHQAPGHCVFRTVVQQSIDPDVFWDSLDLTDKPEFDGKLVPKAVAAFGHKVGCSVHRLVSDVNQKTPKLDADKIVHLPDSKFKEYLDVYDNIVSTAPNKTTRSTLRKRFLKETSKRRTVSLREKRDKRCVVPQSLKRGVDMFRCGVDSLLDGVFGRKGASLDDLTQAVMAIFNRDSTWSEVFSSIVRAGATALSWMMKIVHSVYSSMDVSYKWIFLFILILGLALYYNSGSNFALVIVWVSSGVLLFALGSEDLIPNLMTSGVQLVGEFARRLVPQSIELVSELASATILLVLCGTSKTTKDFGHAIGTFPALNKGVGTVIDMVADYGRRIVDWACDTKYSIEAVEDFQVREFLRLGTDFLAGERDAVNLGPNLLNASVDGKPIRNSIRAAALKSLLDASDSIIREDKLEKLSTSKRQLFMHTTQQLQKVRPDYSVFDNNGDVRIEPVCVGFYGLTSVGKTHLISYLVTALTARLYPNMTKEQLRSLRNKLTYARAAEQDYWDAYLNHLFCVMDDIGQKKDDVSGGVSEYFELIRAVNTFKYPLHCAEINRKGVVDFTSMFIFCTMNEANPKPKTISNLPALYRRFHLSYHVVVREEYSDALGRVDPAKAATAPNPLDIWLFVPYVMGEYTWAPLAKLREIGKPFETVFDEIYDQYTRRQHNHAVSLVDNDRVFDWVRARGVERQGLWDWVPSTYVPRFLHRTVGPFCRRVAGVLDRGTQTCAELTKDWVSASSLWGETFPSHIEEEVTTVQKEYPVPIHECIVGPVQYGLTPRCSTCVAWQMYTDRLIAWNPVDSRPPQSDDDESRPAFDPVLDCWKKVHGKKIPWPSYVDFTSTDVDWLYSWLNHHCIPLIHWRCLVHPAMRQYLLAVSRYQACVQPSQILTSVGDPDEDPGVIESCDCEFETPCAVHIMRSALERRSFKSELPRDKFNALSQWYAQSEAWTRVAWDETDGQDPPFMGRLHEARSSLRGQRFKRMLMKVLGLSVVTAALIGVVCLLSPSPTESDDDDAILDVSEQSTARPRVRLLRKGKKQNRQVNVQKQSLAVTPQSTDTSSLLSLIDNVVTFVYAGKSFGRGFCVGGDVYLTSRHVAETIVSLVPVGANVRLKYDSPLLATQLLSRSDFEDSLRCFSDLGDPNILVAPTHGTLQSMRLKLSAFLETPADPDSGRVYTWMPVWFDKGDREERREILGMTSMVCEPGCDPSIDQLPFMYSHRCNSSRGESGRPLFAVMKKGPLKLIGVLYGAFEDMSESLYAPVDRAWVDRQLARLELFRGRPMIPRPEPPDEGVANPLDHHAGKTVITQSILPHWKGGFLPGYYCPDDTALVPSPIAACLPDSEVAPSHKNWIVRDGVLCHPLVDFITKYPQPEEGPDPSKLFEVAGLMIKKVELHASTSCAPEFVSTEFRRTLTFEEAVCGTKDGLLKPIPRDTSLGYPYILDKTIVGGRRYFLGYEGDVDFSAPGALRLRTDVENLLAKIRSGERPDVYNCTFLKDELRSISKVESGSTRVVECRWLPWFIVMRMLFGGFVMWYLQSKIINGCGLGVNPYSDDWDYLAMSLGSEVCAGDYQTWDHTISSRVFQAAFLAIIRWYGKIDEVARHVAVEEFKYRRTLVAVPRRPRAGTKARELWDQLPAEHWMKKFEGKALVVEPGIGMCSGDFATGSINSFGDVILIKTGHSEITAKSVGESVDDCFACCVGDDNVHTSPDPEFNCVSYAKWLSEFGITYTPPSKKGDLEKFVPLAEASFLKRGFVKAGFKRPGAPWNATLAPLEKESIWKQVAWTKSSCTPDEIIRVHEEAALEASFHGVEFYHEFTSVVAEAWRQVPFELKPTFPDYSTALSKALHVEAQF